MFFSSSSHSGLSSLGDAAATPDPTLNPHWASTPDGAACPSSDEGENEEREESMEKLDCHYSGYHPRPAAVSTSLSPAWVFHLRCRCDVTNKILLSLIKTKLQSNPERIVFI